MTLLERYRAHATTLGRGEDVRRFLTGVLVTTRFHLSSRPISSANDTFARRLATSSDALLALLREDGWAALEADVEHGLAQLAPLAELPGAIDSPAGFRRIYKRWFGVMNPPWSMLAPAPALTIAEWPRPSRILVNVGPNIGIGDEIIFFEAVGRLARQFPHAELEVSSFNRTVWNLCPVPLRVVEPGDDQLAPYARAHDVARTDPTALLVFVEFASTPIYRHLERVAAIPRFVYLDTGARTARVVDQPRERIAEHVERFDGGVYGVLDRLLDKIGLPGAERRPPPVGPRRHPATVFVNTFSSKNYRELEAGWWSAALRSAAAAAGGAGSIEAMIFAGINDECRSYAREIARGCEGAPRATLFGETSVPTIEHTCRAAAAADAVLGLDTFTAHVGVIAPVPCVTIFFGSAWDPWRVRSNHVLNTHVHSQPEVAGRLVARLVGPASPAARHAARTIVELTRARAAAMAGGSTAAPAGGSGIALGDIIDTIDRVSAAIASWAAGDPTLARDFVDVPAEFAGRVRTALVRAARQDLGSAGTARMLRDGLDAWTESNLFRYARYLTDLAPAAPSEP
jgi:hypothetical protein